MADREKAKRATPLPEGRRVALLSRTTPELRQALEDAALRSGRSLAQEVEHRLERSLDDDRLIDVWMGRGTPVAGLFFAMRRVVEKVLRMSKAYAPKHNQDRDDTNLQHEINTRRELKAAIDVVMNVYAATEEGLPHQPSEDNLHSLQWGTGDKARRETYSYLEWEDDPNLDRAKGTAIDSYWTGTGQPVGDLVEAGLLTPEQAERRMFPEGTPRDLADIMNEGRDRDRSAGSPPEPAPKTKRAAKKA